MKDLLVPIDKAGRIVLPKDVRQELAINAGDILKVSVHGNQITLRPDREKAGFTTRGSALVFTTGGPDLLDNEAIENIRCSERGASSINITKGFAQQKH